MNSRARTRRELERTPYKWGAIYKGTREQLLSTGLVEALWFPGDAGNNKVTQSVCIEPGEAPRLTHGQGRDPKGSNRAVHISIMRRGKDWFHLWYSLPERTDSSLVSCASGLSMKRGLSLALTVRDSYCKHSDDEDFFTNELNEFSDLRLAYGALLSAKVEIDAIRARVN